MTLKEYLEKNKYSNANVFLKNGVVVVEFALVDKKRKKVYKVASMENENFFVDVAKLGELSEEIMSIAIKKLSFELDDKRMALLEEITKKIEEGGTE